ncbi:MAG: PQQ-like beta-propeller repeat protein [Candidatus Peribacteraceae bacterium]|nr:PQQ-like beta-propeller repeat protein [Candidatus Peribacteraceae bacterium]
MRKIIIVATIICIILLMNTIVQSQELGNNSPPCYRMNPQHTGHSTYSTEDNTGFLKWTFEIDNSSIRSHPVVSIDGSLLFVASDGFLYSLNVDGVNNWRYQVSSGGSSELNGPAIGQDGTIYCGSGNSTLHALNPDGILKWKYSVNNSTEPAWVSAPVVDSNNNIYFSSYGSGTEGEIYAINQNGTFLWKHNLGVPNPVPYPPAIGNNGVVYASGSGGLFAFASSGNVLWNISFGVYGSNGVSIADDGMIYHITGDSHLYSIYPNGTISWSNDVIFVRGRTASLRPDGRIYLAYHGGSIGVFNSNGSNEEVIEINDYLLSPITISSDGTLYFSSRDFWGNCTIHSMNEDGIVNWEYRTNGLFSSPAVIGEDGTVYIAIENTMYAFGNDKPMPDVLIILGAFVVITVVSSGVIMLVRKRKNKLRDFNE